MVKNLDITLKDENGVDVRVQVRDFLSSEDYFKFLTLQPIHKASEVDKNDPDLKVYIDSQRMQYHLILAMVINPKLDESKLRKMDWRVQGEVFTAVNAFCFPQDEIKEGEPEPLDHFQSAGVLQDEP